MLVRALLGGVPPLIFPLSIIRSVLGRAAERGSPSLGPNLLASDFLLYLSSGLSFTSGFLHDVQSRVWGFLGICSRSHACLNSFISQSLRPTSCTAYKRAGAARDPWPVPPPTGGVGLALQSREPSGAGDANFFALLSPCFVLSLLP